MDAFSPFWIVMHPLHAIGIQLYRYNYADWLMLIPRHTNAPNCSILLWRKHHRRLELKPAGILPYSQVDYQEQALSLSLTLSDILKSESQYDSSIWMWIMLLHLLVDLWIKRVRLEIRGPRFETRLRLMDFYDVKVVSTSPTWRTLSCDFLARRRTSSLQKR